MGERRAVVYSSGLPAASLDVSVKMYESLGLSLSVKNPVVLTPQSPLLFNEKDDDVAAEVSSSYLVPFTITSLPPQFMCRPYEAERK